MNNHLDALKVNKQNKVYKVYNTETGLYSKGGTQIQKCNSCWSKTGKTWSSIGSLKSHLMQYTYQTYTTVQGRSVKGPITFTIPDEWEVVEIDLKLAANAAPDAVTTYNAKTFMIEHVNNKKKR